jgi:hypothetical protein
MRSTQVCIEKSSQLKLITQRFVEQTHIFTCRDQLQNLRHQTHDLHLEKRSAHHTLKSEEHTKMILERKRLMLEHNQLRLQDRIRHLTGQLTNINKQSQTNKRTMSMNIIRLKDQQYKINSIEVALKKLIHLNNNLEKISQEHRFIRINEREKLHSIKQISFEKRKQLVIHTKHLHTLSINKHRVLDNTIRTALEIITLNNILHESNNTEKV